MITKVFSASHTITQVKETRLEKVYTYEEVVKLIAKATGVDSSSIIGLEADANNIKLKFKPKMYP